MRKPFDLRRPRAISRAAVMDEGNRASDHGIPGEQANVLSAYARWAPIYDFVFGKLLFFGAFFDRGRELAIDHINTRTGSVLEVGVGTGLSLSRYRPDLDVTGIDLSPDMLKVARHRVAIEKLSHVRDLIEMDAGNLRFDSASFDTVAVMYVITVVPHPKAVLDEVARVLKPGGEAIIVSHFAANHGWRGWLERRIVPVTQWLGWRSDVPIDLILGQPDLEHVETRRLPPLGVFSIVRLKKVGG